jgi:amino-acid N-acetyltransferase
MKTLVEPIIQTRGITQLLSSCELPIADIEISEKSVFFGCRRDSKLIGIVGLELYESVALLRSLAVVPSSRSHGLGSKLVMFAEEYVQSIGIESLFLLTTTAESFFSRLGYLPISRKDAPLSIQSTAQFSTLCPSSSSLMSKNLF